MYAKPIQELIKAFQMLPSVGSRTAERFVFSLLKSGKKDVAELTIAMKKLMETVKSCEKCWNFSDTTPCRLCTKPDRNQHVICVVAEPQDLLAIEQTGNFNGLYHIIRGTINTTKKDPLNGLKIFDLLERIKKENISEIILALNPNLPGETTMMFLEQECKKIQKPIVLSRLAKGLPMGSDVQYADEITLSNALKNRVEVRKAK